jgi:hypothetical protein
MRATSWLLVSGVLAALLCCGRLDRGVPSPTASATSAGSATPSAQPPILTLGGTAELPTYRAKLVSQRQCGEAYSAQARRATRPWAVELEITNTGTQRLPANPFYATVQDDQKYTYTTSLVGCTPLLPAKSLAPGETVRGYVPYELPLATANVTLYYRPALRGQIDSVARFRLEL